jgi:hypothetical protein
MSGVAICRKTLIASPSRRVQTASQSEFLITRETMRIAALIVLVLMIASPATSLFPSAPQRDVPAEVGAARRALQGARNDLEHTGGEWGGHRVIAMKHIDEAIKQLNEAEKYAREHHDIK